MSTGTGISLALGAWGTGLSSLLALRAWRSDRRKIRLVIGGVQTHQSEDRYIVAVTAVNASKRPVELARIGFTTAANGDRALLPVYGEPEVRGVRGSQSYPHHVEEPALPIVLADGSSATFRAQGPKAGEPWTHLWARDTLRKTYRTRLHAPLERGTYPHHARG